MTQTFNTTGTVTEVAEKLRAAGNALTEAGLPSNLVLKISIVVEIVGVKQQHGAQTPVSAN